MNDHPHGEQLSAYMDGMLDVAQMRDVARHLDQCAACRAFARSAAADADAAAQDGGARRAEPGVLGQHVPPPAGGKPGSAGPATGLLGAVCAWNCRERSAAGPPGVAAAALLGAVACGPG